MDLWLGPPVIGYPCFWVMVLHFCSQRLFMALWELTRPQNGQHLGQVDSCFLILGSLWVNSGLWCLSLFNLSGIVLLRPPALSPSANSKPGSLSLMAQSPGTCHFNNSTDIELFPLHLCTRLVVGKAMAVLLCHPKGQEAARGGEAEMLREPRNRAARASQRGGSHTGPLGKSFAFQKTCSWVFGESWFGVPSHVGRTTVDLPKSPSLRSTWDKIQTAYFGLWTDISLCLGPSCSVPISPAWFWIRATFTFKLAQFER